MNKADLNNFYRRTTEAYRKEPNLGELAAWDTTLSEYSAADLDAALRRWQCDLTVEEFTRRPRGSRMPSAAELRLSIENFDRANAEQFIPCGRDGCEGGWVRVTSGKTYHGNQVDPKLGALKRCQCFLRWVERQKTA